jgi:hypothetical protein
MYLISLPCFYGPNELFLFFYDGHMSDGQGESLLIVDLLIILIVCGFVWYDVGRMSLYQPIRQYLPLKVSNKCKLCYGYGLLYIVLRINYSKRRSVVKVKRWAVNAATRPACQKGRARKWFIGASYHALRFGNEMLR